jgi:hypothetical protein
VLSAGARIVIPLYWQLHRRITADRFQASTQYYVPGALIEFDLREKNQIKSVREISASNWRPTLEMWTPAWEC